MQFKFFFSEAINSLVRNWVMSVAAVVTVLISMLILGVGMIFFFNIEDVISDLKNKLEIEVFIKNTATQDEINDLGAEIQGMPEVDTVYFISKDEALERMRKQLGENADMLDAMSGNPLPASYQIRLKDPQNLKEVAERFYDNPVVDNTPGKDPPDGVKYGGETSERVLRLTTILLIIIAGTVALLTVASVLLISNTIRLSIFARRREIEIMRLVGATNLFIRWPYVIEGLFSGLLGASIATVTVMAFNSFLMSSLKDKMPFLGFQEVPMFTIALVIISVGTLVGTLGSGLALRRFLKI
ncbi:MAG: permease-like cell division protein FtsX [Thermoleophilia bacterium]